jgi:hypothetical protein
MLRRITLQVKAKIERSPEKLSGPTFGKEYVVHPNPEYLCEVKAYHTIFWAQEVGGSFGTRFKCVGDWDLELESWYPMVSYLETWMVVSIYMNIEYS